MNEMIKAYILARKIRKVEKKMDKVKEWAEQHKVDIVIGLAIVMAYRLGFKAGCRATDNAVSHLFKEASKVIEVTKF